MAARPLLPGLRLPQLNGTPPIQPPPTFTAGAPQAAKYNSAVQDFLTDLVSTSETRLARREQRLAAAGSLASDPRVADLVVEVRDRVKRGEIQADQAVDELYRRIRETTGERLRSTAEQIRFQHDYGQNTGRAVGQRLRERANDPDLGFLLTPQTLDAEVKKFRAELDSDPIISAPGTAGSIARVEAATTFAHYVEEFRQLADANLSVREEQYHRETVRETLVRSNPEEREAGSRGFLDFIAARPEDFEAVSAGIVAYLDSPEAAIPAAERASEAAAALAGQVNAYASEGRYAEAATLAERALSNTRLSNGVLLGEVTAGQAGVAVAAIRETVRDFERRQVEQDTLEQNRLALAIQPAATAAAWDAAREGGDPREQVAASIQSVLDATPELTAGMSPIEVEALIAEASLQGIKLANEVEKEDRQAALKTLDRLAVQGDEEAVLKYAASSPDPLVQERGKAIADGREARLYARDNSSTYRRVLETVEEIENAAEDVGPDAVTEAGRLRQELTDVDGGYLAGGPASDPDTLTDDVLNIYTPVLQKYEARLTDLRAKAAEASALSSAVSKALADDDLAGAQAALAELAKRGGNPDELDQRRNAVESALSFNAQTVAAMGETAINFAEAYLEAGVDTADPDAIAEYRQKSLTIRKQIPAMLSAYVEELRQSGVSTSAMRLRAYELGNTLGERFLTEQGSSPVPTDFPDPPSLVSVVASQLAIDSSEGTKELYANAAMDEARAALADPTRTETGVELALKDIDAIVAGDRTSLVEMFPREPVQNLWTVSAPDSAEAIYRSGISVGSFDLASLASGEARITSGSTKQIVYSTAKAQGITLPRLAEYHGFGPRPEPVQAERLGAIRDVTLGPGVFGTSMSLEGTFDLPDTPIGRYFVASLRDVRSGLSADELYTRAVKAAGDDEAPLLKRLGAKNREEAVRMIEDGLERQKTISDL